MIVLFLLGIDHLLVLVGVHKVLSIAIYHHLLRVLLLHLEPIHKLLVVHIHLLLRR